MATQYQPGLRSSTSPPSSLVAIPEYVIHSFIPGAQPLLAKYPFLFRSFGFLLAFWYLEPVTRLQAVWSKISTLVVSTVVTSSNEDLFDYLSTYLYEKKTLRADQKLNALSTPLQNQDSIDDSDAEEISKSAKQEPKVRYEPSSGTEFFFHNRRLFWACKSEGQGERFFHRSSRRTETLSFSCLGRSTQPIKELLEEVFRVNKDKEKTLTIIRRPHTSSYGNNLAWSRLTSKPRRALDTVVLDAAKKSAVVADIEEYMDESTAAFYGSHGIPYRRGYMFYGPPGTGKTSFALALASKFHMDVYVISLLDQAITDSDLVSLFNLLPSRSLLLLEDIDTAGLSKRKAVTPHPHSRFSPDAADRFRAGPAGSESRSSSTTRADQHDSQDNGMSKNADHSGNRGGDHGGDDDDDDESDANNPAVIMKGPSSRVSLSGLLNAIDGVAAPEGHILILTTNKPYNLDDALVRAGRISVRVPFTNATKTQAKELFTRMYVDADLPLAPPPSSYKATSSSGGGNLNGDGHGPSTTATTLDELASQFSAAIPDQEFSPADLQDYLLGYKKNPIGAVQGVFQWMAEQAEERQRREARAQDHREKKRKNKNTKEKDLVESLMSIVKENKKKENKSKGNRKESPTADTDGDDSVHDDADDED